MSIPEARYTLGQLVMTRHIKNKQFDSDCCVIESVEYSENEMFRFADGGKGVQNGWFYQIFLNGGLIWVIETNIRPRPEPAETGFDALMADFKHACDHITA